MTAASGATIPLRIDWKRYGIGALILAATGSYAVYLSLGTALLRRSGDAKARAIAQMLRTVPRVGGVWPLPMACGIFLLVLAALVLWGALAPRRLELVIDAHGVSFPVLLPSRGPLSFTWDELDSVSLNEARDHVVFLTAHGRKVLPVWWLPPETPPAEVLAIVQRTRPARRAGTDAA